jgi:hypothetical protein
LRAKYVLPPRGIVLVDALSLLLDFPVESLLLLLFIPRLIVDGCARPLTLDFAKRFLEE